MSYHVGAAGGKARLGSSRTSTPIFPLFYTYYDKNPAGTVAIRNASAGPVQDVTASFYVKEYMEQPKNFWTAPALNRNQQVSVPVYALFDQRIFDVTTETKAAGEITAHLQVPRRGGFDAPARHRHHQQQERHDLGRRPQSRRLRDLH